MPVFVCSVSYNRSLHCFMFRILTELWWLWKSRGTSHWWVCSCFDYLCDGDGSMLHILEITSTLEIKIFILLIIFIYFLFQLYYLFIISRMIYVPEKFVFKWLLYSKQLQEKFAEIGRVWVFFTLLYKNQKIYNNADKKDKDRWIAVLCDQIRKLLAGSGSKTFKQDLDKENHSGSRQLRIRNEFEVKLLWKTDKIWQFIKKYSILKCKFIFNLKTSPKKVACRHNTLTRREVDGKIYVKNIREKKIM